MAFLRSPGLLDCDAVHLTQLTSLCQMQCHQIPGSLQQEESRSRQIWHKPSTHRGGSRVQEPGPALDNLEEGLPHTVQWLSSSSFTMGSFRMIMHKEKEILTSLQMHGFVDLSVSL